ncbi:hypothetical protein EXIGLDRAFT_735553 [Exidia glandulosa HHB12029]|uniref:Uncharacterized protein n=1 Tax=Exidia glandulosa HHB12029 TaxID=1314781 RepID=A0A165JS32_EXIGL|nr:hypothetical protein EXIGLDRAFT_735553 [Exidia glandulosa HHB12029]
MHLSAPIHLSFCYLDYDESHIYPEPIRGEGDTDDAVIELHSAADNSRVTVVLDHYQLSHALEQLYEVSERITQITMEFGQSLLEVFDALPQLTTLRVLLSDTPDTVSRHTFNKKPIVECPLLDIVVVYAPGQYGLDRLDEIRAAIHFVAPKTKRGDPNRPRLILQGDALPKLASAPTLRSRVREVTLEPTHSISIMAGCCRTTPISVPSA